GQGARQKGAGRGGGCGKIGTGKRARVFDGPHHKGGAGAARTMRRQSLPAAGHGDLSGDGGDAQAQVEGVRFLVKRGDCAASDELVRRNFSGPFPVATMRRSGIGSRAAQTSASKSGLRFDYWGTNSLVGGS